MTFRRLLQTILSVVGTAVCLYVINESTSRFAPIPATVLLSLILSAEVLTGLRDAEKFRRE